MRLGPSGDHAQSLAELGIPEVGTRASKDKKGQLFREWGRCSFRGFKVIKPGGKSGFGYLAALAFQRFSFLVLNTDIRLDFKDWEVSEVRIDSCVNCLTQKHSISGHHYYSYAYI